MAEILKDADGNAIVVQEGESSNITANFLDMADDPILKANLLSLEMTLVDVTTEAVINSWSGVDVLDANGGTVTTDGTLTMRLEPDDNTFVGATTQETHLARFEWTWNDGVAVRTGVKEVVFDVENVKP